MITVSQINKRISKYGYELVRNHEHFYFYFVPLKNKFPYFCEQDGGQDSIPVARLNHICQKQDSKSIFNAWKKELFESITSYNKWRREQK